MIVWVREPKRRRLTGIELKPEPEIEIKKIAEQDRNKRPLNEIFFSLHV